MANVITDQGSGRGIQPKCKPKGCEKLGDLLKYTHLERVPKSLVPKCFPLIRGVPYDFPLSLS
jgi:hypothetical protein